MPGHVRHARRRAPHQRRKMDLRLIFTGEPNRDDSPAILIFFGETDLYREPEIRLSRGRARPLPLGGTGGLDGFRISPAPLSVSSTFASG